ncbi:MAG: divergent PAP2 family protein [Bacillota bacterium]|nr:divergent PAP2 family protein [Bacillota bacterium]
MFEQIFGNFPLMAAVVALLVAQVMKLPIHALTDGEVDISRVFGSGGMPSSHSAFVVALISALIIHYGWAHPLVAIAIVFGIIVMYDAFGVRRESGKQATVINMLVDEMQFVSSRASTFFSNGPKRGESLKELLGHEPIEILAGAILGVVVAIMLFRFY